MQIITLNNKDFTAQIAPDIGNTLYSLVYKNQERLYFPFTLDEYQSSSKLAGNPFMHPWANRLEDDFITIKNTKHKFPNAVKNSIYRDANQLPQHKAVCHFNLAEELSVFPYKHQLTMSHELVAENEIKITTTILYLAAEEMPVSFGFHPYFILNEKRENTVLTIPALNVIETDKKQIPNGYKSAKEMHWGFNYDEIILAQHTFDHGFTDFKKNENGEAVFRLNDIEICFDKNYPYAQIYAPLHPDKPYVCIEPMTAITNALNTNSCPMLKPNENFVASFSIRFLS
jgi:aldose 1-epimerase